MGLHSAAISARHWNIGAKVTPHLAGHRRLRFSFFRVAHEDRASGPVAQVVRAHA